AHKGYPPLRQLIARRLRLHGISVSSEEILITNGAQQAIDLLIRVLSGPGEKIAVESPTYANVIPILQFSGAKILGIPMRKDGMDLNFLESVLNRERVSFVYTIPNFQNPTGITTSHPHREKLLNVCLRHKVPIVEDGFEEDMKYFGKVPLPIKSIDEKNIVIYLGTFSKALFPGLRIGWITADKGCISRATALKRFSDLTSGNLSQIILHEFLNRGYYDLHLKRLHRVFRKRMQVALQTMENCFPDAVTWTRPSGGYTIWVKMPLKLDEHQLHGFMARYGVVVSPGRYYFPNRLSSEYIRISIARIDEKEIREGISRLGEALRELSKGSQR
ncbi:MAG: PLP-dependent aminotransferase family protein, partial [Candidatus Aminicenantes bacterium]|nr:PLP-dependent aminotransferase family protein [Candidatus Aminicenantes bacterium]